MTKDLPREDALMGMGITGNSIQGYTLLVERHNQTLVFWYLPVICGGPLKVPWDHRRRLLCFDESPLSTNIYPADLFILSL